jgi:hypothetical protein
VRERGQRPGSIYDRSDSIAHPPTPGKNSLVSDIDSTAGGGVASPGKRSITGELADGSAAGGGVASPGKRSITGELAAVPSGTSSGGAPLRDDVRSRMESAFGSDFSAVRIHEDGAADSAGAQAYARGTDLHFGPGTYDPDSPQGLELIGHELTHVVQQRQGRAPGRAQMKSTLVVNDSSLEREADALGARAARGEYVGMFTGTAAPGSIQRKTQVNPGRRGKEGQGHADRRRHARQHRPVAARSRRLYQGAGRLVHRAHARRASRSRRGVEGRPPDRKGLARHHRAADDARR